MFTAPAADVPTGGSDEVGGIPMGIRIDKNRGGFNAIELVVVILLVFIVLGLVLVAIKHRQEINSAAGRTQTNNNLKQLSLTCHSANDVFKRLPPAFDNFGQMDFPASVHVHLLPYAQDDFYKRYLVQKGKGNVTNEAYKPFLSPMDPTQTNDGAGAQNFAANLRVFSAKGMATNFDANMPALAGIEPGKTSIPIPDGTSNTIFFTLKYSNCQDGGSRYVAAPDSKFAAFFGQNAATVSPHPSDPNAAFQDQPTIEQCVSTPLMPQSMSKYGLSVGMGDGSVRMINPSISPRTWNLAVQPNDGMELGNDW
jgi:uncharacterized protein DUF1559